ncbi:hypothetical protein [Rhodococcus sp. JVH1]|uniref:SbtR family transcriptional regulator n=1 Tax=Rhodococcus sp. JVH1 TaxID=745408 RepID=UPI00178C6831|nr:hypothetical protein [Rhodococcus sp. JVH1]
MSSGNRVQNQHHHRDHETFRRAQSAGVARTDLDGSDLYALIGALAWLTDQPSTAPPVDHLLDVIADAPLRD